MTEENKTKAERNIDKMEKFNFQPRNGTFFLEFVMNIHRFHFNIDLESNIKVFLIFTFFGMFRVVSDENLSKGWKIEKLEKMKTKNYFNECLQS